MHGTQTFDEVVFGMTRCQTKQHHGQALLTHDSEHAPQSRSMRLPQLSLHIATKSCRPLCWRAYRGSQHSNAISNLTVRIRPCQLCIQCCTSPAFKYINSARVHLLIARGGETIK
jgi:hypothetical protein